MSYSYIFLEVFLRACVLARKCPNEQLSKRATVLNPTPCFNLYQHFYFPTKFRFNSLPLSSVTYPEIWRCEQISHRRYRISCGRHGISCGRHGISCGRHGISCGRHGISFRRCGRFTLEMYHLL
jgi:hypothetical protein